MIAYARQRRKDSQEWVMNLLYGTVFWVCLFGSLGEKLGYIEGGRFGVGFQAVTWIVIVSIWLMIGFMIFAANKHLRGNWNNKAELVKSSDAINAALKRLNALSLITFGLIVGVCAYVGFKWLAVALLASTIAIFAGVATISHIGRSRATKL